MKRITLRVPGSKSMTQRALMIGALASKDTAVRGALACDDSAHLTRALVSLGAQVEWDSDSVRVRPRPLVASGQTLSCGNGGTAIRFAACLSLVTSGRMTVDGDARMRQRPIGALGEALGRLGVRVEFPLTQGFPPMSTERASEPPDTVEVDATASSQFASGLLLVAPRLARGLSLRLAGNVVSAPYLRMTTTMMSRAGASARWLGDTAIAVGAGLYFSDERAAVLDVEPDWSSASFLLAAGFVAGLDVRIDGLPEPARSCQGDAVFAELLDELRRPVDHDIALGASPDLIAPLAAAALFASRPTRIRDVGHARIKESDRIAVLCTELRKAGARIDEYDDGLLVRPWEDAGEVDAVLDPHGDHRMAMAFGVISLRIKGVRSSDPQCVSKSFPSFWAQLDELRAGES